MNKKFCFFIIILFVLFTGCSKQNDKLIVDEIYISKHNVGPPLSPTLKYISPDEKSYFVETIDSIALDSADIVCFKSFLISKSGYNPKFILHANLDGKVTGYIKDCVIGRDGYFEFTLSDSLCNYFNRQIEKMNYRKLRTIYDSDEDGSFYCGPEYFISIKNGNEVKQVLILNEYKGPRNIIRFIDSLYHYTNTLELSDSVYIPNRKDTVIVLESEKYFSNKFNE
jgi:hypothetical protein